MGGVARADGLGVRCGVEALDRVLADGLQKRQAAVLRDDEALGHEPVQRVDPRPCHRLRRLDVTAAGECAERGEGALLVVFEQREAPVQRGAKRLLARGRVAGAAAEHSERVGQPRGERGRVEDAEPPGGELDGERQPVEALADRAHGFDVVQTRVRVRRLRTALEQRDGGRQRQRVEREALLGAQAERLAARRQHGERGGVVEQPRQPRPGRQHVLEVVEHEQRPAVGEGPREGRLGGLIRHARYGEGVANRGRDEVGVGGRGERHEAPSGDCGRPRSRAASCRRRPAR